MKTSRIIILLVLVPWLAFGQSAVGPITQVDADVPLIANLPAKGRTMELEAGEILPFAATCLDKQQAKREAKICAYHESEALDLKKGNVIVPTPVFVTLVSAGVVAVIVAVIATGFAAKKAP